MNTYNLTVVLDGKTTAAKRKNWEEKLSALIESFEGKVGKVKDMGIKDLAYTIGKSETGLYINFPLELVPDSVKKINDKLRVDEGLLRYLLVKLEPTK